MKTLEKLKQLWNSYSVVTRRRMITTAACLFDGIAMYCAVRLKLASAVEPSSTSHPVLVTVGALGVVLTFVLTYLLGRTYPRRPRVTLKQQWQARRRWDWRQMTPSAIAKRGRLRMLAKFHHTMAFFRGRRRAWGNYSLTKRITITVFALSVFWALDWVTDVLMILPNPLLFLASIVILIIGTAIGPLLLISMVREVLKIRRENIRRDEEYQRESSRSGGDRP